PLGVECDTNAVNRRRRCPHAAREGLPAFVFLDHPMVAGFLHTAGQGGVTGRQKDPALRHGQDFAIGCTDGVPGRCGGEGAGAVARRATSAVFLRCYPTLLTAYSPRSRHQSSSTNAPRALVP